MEGKCGIGKHLESGGGHGHSLHGNRALRGIIHPEGEVHGRAGAKLGADFSSKVGSSLDRIILHLLDIAIS